MDKRIGLYGKVVEIFNALAAHAVMNGVEIIMTQGLRTVAEQDALYAQGRTKPGKIVTNAKGGQSFHNYGLAFDIALIHDGQVIWDTKISVEPEHPDIPTYTELGQYGQAIGAEWGGSWHFQDIPHFQYTYGLSLQDVQLGKRPNDTKFTG